MATYYIYTFLRLDPDKKLHTREHLLADDLSKMMLEPKKFAAYLGLAQLYHESELRTLAKYVLGKKDLPPEARGKYFFAAVGGLKKKMGAKLKNAKRKLKNFRKSRNKNAGNKTNRKRTKSSPASKS